MRDLHAVPVTTRDYGNEGTQIMLLHGGPGAPGYVAPIARRLASRYRVIEPFQRGRDQNAGEPLSVARHIADLHHVIETKVGEKPVLVGHSWGAMLALAYLAEHMGSSRSLVLIGCGTFDKASRARLQEIRRSRMDDKFKRRETAILSRFTDPDERLKAIGSLHQRLDSVELMKHKDETAAFDAKAHEQTWADMIRLQEADVYPAAFSRIKCPVLMLHGVQDPHPGGMIRDSLLPFLPQLEYHELSRCGHYPWLEKHAHEEFYRVLFEWLDRH